MYSAKKGKKEHQAVRKPFLIMKTVNDAEFDVSKIQKYSKNDYKMIKVCRESLKPVIKALENNDLVNFSFEWTASFNESVFSEDIQKEIIPIILVLKKFARTNFGNCSLRSVLARKLVNLKLKFGMMDPDEMPKPNLQDENATNEDLERQATSGDIIDKFMITDEGTTMPYEITRGYQDSFLKELVH